MLIGGARHELATRNTPYVEIGQRRMGELHAPIPAELSVVDAEFAHKPDAQPGGYRLPILGARDPLTLPALADVDDDPDGARFLQCGAPGPAGRKVGPPADALSHRGYLISSGAMACSGRGHWGYGHH